MDQFASLNIHNIHLWDCHPPNNAFAVTSNEIGLEIYVEVNNRRLIASYIHMHADVILEHLLGTMHNRSLKPPSFSTFVFWSPTKIPQENKMEQSEPPGLKFTLGKYAPKVYSRLLSRP